MSRFSATDDLSLHVLEAERAFNDLNAPQQPTPLFSSTTAAMPPAANWTGFQLWNATIKRICVSDGASWLRQDTGASV